MIIYRIDRPYSTGSIEVYTVEEGSASYEWRIMEHGANIHDTASHGSYGMNFGSPAVALRDAISWDMGELA